MAGGNRKTGPSWRDRRQFRPEWHPHPVRGLAYDAPSMVKADLINRAVEETDLERWVIRDAVDALFESVGSALERGDRVVRFRPASGSPPPSGRRLREPGSLGSRAGDRSLTAYPLDRLLTLAAGIAATFGASAEALDVTTAAR